MIVTFITLLFVSLYPLLKFLQIHSYPLFKPEIFVLITGTILVSILLWLLSLKKRAIFHFIFSFCVFWIVSIAPTADSPRVIAIKATLALCLFFVLRLIDRKPRPVLYLLFMVGMLAGDFLAPHPAANTLGKTTVVLSKEAPFTIEGTTPHHILYFIFDEQLGLDGFDHTTPRGAEVKKEIELFFQKYGFTIFPKAFSQYFFTDNSLSNTLNNSSETILASLLEQTKSGIPLLKKNKFFDWAAGQGKNIRVYQSTYMDFCAWPGVIDLCYTYPKNSIAALANTAYTTKEKAWVIASSYLTTNSLFQEVNKHLTDRDIFKTRTGPLTTFPNLMEQLQKDLASTHKDSLFFVHAPIPHFPYVYDKDCRPRPVSEWQSNKRFNTGPHKNTPNSYLEKYNLYDDQVLCIYKTLDGFLTELKTQNLYDGMTIIMQGDHGSRINLDTEPYYNDYGKISAQDMITSHATLMAFKRAGQTQFESDPQLIDITRILWNRFLKVKPHEINPQPVVILKQKKGKKEMIPVPMPAI